MAIKCPICKRIFDPSPEEERRCFEKYGKPDSNGHTYVECNLPKYCSWECFKMARGLRFNGNKENEEKSKAKNRWLFHIGDIPPRPGSEESRKEYAEYLAKKQKSLEEKPPRFTACGFSENISTVTMLPSEYFLGNPTTRVLDDFSYHLGGEDGEKFNFENE